MFVALFLPLKCYLDERHYYHYYYYCGKRFSSGISMIVPANTIPLYVYSKNDIIRRVKPPILLYHEVNVFHLKWTWESFPNMILNTSKLLTTEIFPAKPHPWATTMRPGMEKMTQDINGVSSILVLHMIPDISPLNYFLCFCRCWSPFTGAGWTKSLQSMNVCKLAPPQLFTSPEWAKLLYFNSQCFWHIRKKIF